MNLILDDSKSIIESFDKKNKIIITKYYVKLNGKFIKLPRETFDIFKIRNLKFNEENIRELL